MESEGAEDSEQGEQLQPGTAWEQGRTGVASSASEASVRVLCLTGWPARFEFGKLGFALSERLTGVNGIVSSFCGL